MAHATAGRVVLDLTFAEAQLLVDILHRISGMPDTTRRGMADGMARALAEAGVGCTAGDDFEPDYTLHLA